MGDEAKDAHKRIMAKAKRIIAYSTKDLLTLVQVINFATAKRGNIHEKAWILPCLSVLSRGNNFVAIETTPNLHHKSDNVLYFIR